MPSASYPGKRNTTGGHHSSLGCKALSISTLEFNSHARTGKTRGKFSIHRRADAVKKHAFDTNVVVEILQMA